MERRKVICVVGPTACGKTTLGVLLAKKYGGEVVSADSMQISPSCTAAVAPPAAPSSGIVRSFVRSTVSISLPSR